MGYLHVPALMTIQRNKQGICGIGYLPLKVKLIGYLLCFLLGIRYIWVAQLFPYTFYTTSTNLIRYPLIIMLFVTLSLKNNWVFKKNVRSCVRE